MKVRRADDGLRSQGFKIIVWPLRGFPRQSSGGCVGVRGGRHPVDVGAGQSSRQACTHPVRWAQDGCGL